MENMPDNFESREKEIDLLIENLATNEGMDPDDILSDAMTFLELSTQDQDAGAYLEELSERLGISVEEIIRYITKKTDDLERN